MSCSDPDSVALLRDPKSCELPNLDHASHVRVAWLLLRERGLVETLRQLPPMLRAYAASKGCADVYHETITFAFVCLVHEHLVGADTGATWVEFATNNPELFESGLLSRFYQKHVLATPRARQTLLLPRMMPARS